MGFISGNSKEPFRGKHHELTERVIGVFYAVANELGSGFVESVYRRAMSISLMEAGFVVRQEVPIDVWFHGQCVGVYKADIVVNGAVVLELKVAEEVSRQFDAQLLHYLRASDIEVGMVLAFGSKAQFRRVVMDNKLKGQKLKRNTDQMDKSGIATIRPDSSMKTRN